ncbi:polysaccharide deacetylase family protein [Sulfurihydrogenibium subterraneum]|uniref:polysaccharide deacetylase family protein n=1 Tax=Sulfurihydrogenibium subterraneum TaxID=171121 RepID=UPI00048DD32A|nr:polysaccharide deacetylase family protein [Sulfurihydrogenibium subterraneum]
MAELFVIYYHKILPRWGFDVYYKTFEREVKILKSFYNIITLDDVYDYIKSGKTPDKPSVAITFDDGYADNFVYAYPILKKHGLKATIFPIVSRLIKKDTVRPTLFDYWEGKVSFNQLHQAKTMADANSEYLRYGYSQDFLTVQELKQMSDVFDIGGHASIHSRVFYSDEVIDFYDGKNGHWSFLYAYEEEPQLGFPIFPSLNNLAVERSFLKKEVKEYIKSLDKSFFKQKNWKELLKQRLKENFSSLVETESKEERKNRVYKELKQSKEELKNLLGIKIRHFAYPFGHYDETLVEITKNFFDTAFTTEKKSIKENTDLHKIPRFAIAKDFTSFLAVLGKAKFKK